MLPPKFQHKTAKPTKNNASTPALATSMFDKIDESSSKRESRNSDRYHGELREILTSSCSSPLSFHGSFSVKYLRFRSAHVSTNIKVAHITPASRLAAASPLQAPLQHGNCWNTHPTASSSRALVVSRRYQRATTNSSFADYYYNKTLPPLTNTTTILFPR
jgi:hypothetical protein